MTDSALLRLLNKFGTAASVERHSSRNFAHVSIDPRDEKSIERCVAALNNTTWCGASLKVQKAKEHFWHRLEREWMEPQVAHDEDAAVDGEKPDQAKKLSFQGVWKGKRTVFSFPDIPEGETVGLLEADLPADANDDIAEVEGGSAPMCDSEGAGKPPRASKVSGISHTPKSATISSTMQLFGLSESVSNPPKPDETVALPNIGRIPGSQQRPSKRPRAKLSSADLQEAEIAAHEPELINLDSEKEAALSVLRNMFPGTCTDETSREERIAAHRRLGLFRKLEIEHSSELASCHQKRRKRNVVNVATNTTANIGASTSVQTESAKAIITGPIEHRRAGLYKKLMGIDSNSVSQAAGEKQF